MGSDGAMTLAELEALIDERFPQARGMGWQIESIGHRRARLRLPVTDMHLRPGGTVSGPVLMTMVDTAVYFAVLASIGPVPLAVTTNLNINFLRKPTGPALIAEAFLLKLGKRLAVGEVTISVEGDDEAVAHGTATYSIPPR